MNPKTRSKRAPPTRTKPRAEYVAAERISDLIGRIYDCVLDPTKWRDALARVGEEFDFDSSVLAITPLRAGPHIINAHVGVDAEWLAVSDSYRADGVELWGGAERLRQTPLDEPIVASQVVEPAVRESNRYFAEVLKPRGVIDAMMITIAAEPSLWAYAGFNRHQAHGYIGEGEIRGIRILGPHFRRAATISNLFDLKAIEASTFASTLDSFAFAIVLVDERLGIVHANATARTMLAANTPIRSHRGVLGLPSPPAHAALERAVKLAAGDEAALGARGIGIPLRDGKGEPSVLHVLPLRRGEIARSLAQRATAALFVTPATTPPRTPADALAVLYDLTPAEVRVLELLTAGATQAAIGETLSIAPSTVKSHVLRLFDKTGCRRQIDLVRLAAKLSLPV
jgi:DNA-binding CsgD family transcriptional regulator